MLNRPETFNAKRGITMDEMADSLLDAAGDSSIRVVVISGAGPVPPVGRQQSPSLTFTYPQQRGHMSFRTTPEG